MSFIRDDARAILPHRPLPSLGLPLPVSPCSCSTSPVDCRRRVLLSSTGWGVSGTINASPPSTPIDANRRQPPPAPLHQQRDHRAPTVSRTATRPGLKIHSQTSSRMTTSVLSSPRRPLPISRPYPPLDVSLLVFHVNRRTRYTGDDEFDGSGGQ
ncbi:hypothetical protein GALMADRAFT_141889 [Galerina marginata CBS 339.88]|uniref:Uncharacterized protein n=1 Tax=Galerina marginata (strain CBS 339.88) TaxID=685588 RepID=A0A067T2L2_GALM3|nr:hypothetical protein GALMADRAFT_141889 [Galerina marginata CBS 339.88]